MKYLVTAFLMILSFMASANDGVLKVKNGSNSVEINSNTELGDLCYEIDLEKEVIKALQNTTLSLKIDDKFSSTPFLYFFNGLIPKDSQDKRIWSIGGHYLNIVKLGSSIFVNNLYQCNSLRLSKDKSHLICIDNQNRRLINFDGTIRDNHSTGDICPIDPGTKSISYGNCLMLLEKDSLRCKVQITWPTGQINTIEKYCKSVEIEGDVLHCRRKKIKNSERLYLDGNCLTDSSVMTAPKVFDAGRSIKFDQIQFEGFEGKEPQTNSKVK